MKDSKIWSILLWRDQITCEMIRFDVLVALISGLEFDLLCNLIISLNNLLHYY